MATSHLSSPYPKVAGWALPLKDFSWHILYILSFVLFFFLNLKQFIRHLLIQCRKACKNINITSNPIAKMTLFVQLKGVSCLERTLGHSKYIIKPWRPLSYGPRRRSVKLFISFRKIKDLLWMESLQGPRLHFRSSQGKRSHHVVRSDPWSLLNFFHLLLSRKDLFTSTPAFWGRCSVPQPVFRRSSLDVYLFGLFSGLCNYRSLYRSLDMLSKSLKWIPRGGSLGPALLFLCIRLLPSHLLFAVWYLPHERHLSSLRRVRWDLTEFPDLNVEVRWKAQPFQQHLSG